MSGSGRALLAGEDPSSGEGGARILANFGSFSVSFLGSRDFEDSLLREGWALKKWRMSWKENQGEFH